MTISVDRAERQLSFVLHSRPYRETSALVDYFSRDQGLIRAVAKGVRSAKSRQRHLTQPFQCLELNWRGKGDLKSLSSGDLNGSGLLLQGRSLWCGLYLNELTLRLVPQGDAYPKLFAYYQLALERLSDPSQQEVVLRIYERQLLQQLGLGVDLQRTASGQLINAQQRYRFDPQHGFTLLDASLVGLNQTGYPGALLLAIAADDYQRIETRRGAKRLMRQALAAQLGGRPLHSRQLFQGAVAHPSSAVVAAL